MIEFKGLSVSKIEVVFYDEDGSATLGLLKRAGIWAFCPVDDMYLYQQDLRQIADKLEELNNH